MQAILHVIDTTGPGGAETVFIQLSKATRDIGIKTISLIRGPGWVKQELNKLGLDVRVKDCKGSFNFSYLFYLVQLIRSEKITLIQSHLLGSSVYASLAGIITRTPVIATFHGHVDISPNEKFQILKFLFIKMGCKYVVAVSSQIKELLSSLSFIDITKKLKVISNGIDHNYFKNQNRRENIDKVSPIIFGCLGNVRNAKNYSLAIDFIEYLNNQKVPVKLIIAGDDTNSLASDLKKKLKNSKVKNKVDFVGFIDCVPKFLSETNIFLMTSSTEGHPLAITQALSCKIPILSTPSGVEEILPSNTAFICEKHTAQSLFHTFLKLFNLRHDKMEIRLQKGRDIVVSNYSLDSMYSEYFKLYGIN